MTGATSYKVKRALTSGGPFTTLATPAGTVFADTGVAAGVSYFYVVSAVSGPGESADCPQVVATVGGELHALLACDETTGKVAADISGNGRHGALVNGPLFVAGKAGNAVDLDGANDYVALPAGVVSTLTGFTIAAWVNPDTLSNWARVFDFGSDTTAAMYLTPRSGNGLLEFTIFNSTTNHTLTATALPTGAWSHVAITFSGSTATLTVNGTAAATNSAITLKPSGLGYTTQNWIGRSQFADPYLDGKVDDFRIYNRALSTAEINKLRGTAAAAAPTALTANDGSSQIALAWPQSLGATSYKVKRSTTNGGPYTLVTTVNAASYADTALSVGTPFYYVVSAVNPAGTESANSPQATATPTAALAAENAAVYLKMDEASGTTTADVSGNGWPGTLVNGPTRTTGRLDRAISFDGSNDHVTLPTGVVSSVGDCTLSAWVFASATTTWARLFDFGTGTNNFLYFAPKASTGKPRFSIRTPGTDEQFIESSADFPLNAWTHVAVTISGDTGTLFLNGVAVGGNGAMSLKPSSLGSTTQNYLGRSQFADPYFAGLMDEFQIRSRALTETEIVALANPPAAPTSLAATGNDHAIALTWAAIVDATAYTIKRSTVTGGPYTTVASGITGTTFSNTGLTAGTTYFYIITAQKLVADSAASAQASATALSTIEAWRRTWLGTADSTGTAADTADANNDGELNLMEFATGQNPNATTTVTPAYLKTGATLEFTYTRSVAALSELTFAVEWNDTLAAGSWSTAGVTGQILTNNGTVQTVKASVPAGAGSRRFLRLKVTRP